MFRLPFMSAFSNPLGEEYKPLLILFPEGFFLLSSFLKVGIQSPSKKETCDVYDSSCKNTWIPCNLAL